MPKKENRLYILAPNDRFNYGDLLFSKVLERYFTPFFKDIVLCSTTSADLTRFGGDVVYGYNKLLEVDDNYHNYLIVAGGECLFASWWRILSFVKLSVALYNNIVDAFSKLQLVNDSKAFSLKNSFSKRCVGAHTQYPFTISKLDFPQFDAVIYNSLGCSWILPNSKELQNKDNIKTLQNVDFISVRDNNSFNVLSKYVPNIRLTADSAILLSDFLTEDFLVSHICKDKLSFYSKDSHFFFQINESTLMSYGVDDVAKQLLRLFQIYKKRICLCPIGTALGHNDDIALKRIYSVLGGEISILIDNPTIWDIMWLIKNSSAYIGTSLHGTITAMSYNVPFLCLSNKKVLNYLTTWVKDSQLHLSSPQDISVSLEVALESKYDASIQKESVLKSFAIMKKMINS